VTTAGLPAITYLSRRTSSIAVNGSGLVTGNLNDSAFVLATAIGSAPAVFIFAGLGAGLGAAIHGRERLDASLIARPGVILPLTALALMSLAPALWRLWRGRPRRAMS